MTNLDWLDDLTDKYPILLKDFKVEIENIHAIHENEVLKEKRVLELLEKHVVKLEKDSVSFRRKELVTKACKEAIPKKGEGYQAIPLWKLELESILDHLTFNSVEYEKVSSNIGIHRLNKKLIKLAEAKMKSHINIIYDNLERNLASYCLVAPPTNVKEIDIITVVALDQETESIGEYFGTISDGIKKPLYAVFSVSLLCMLFFGGSIFTMASGFFSNHSAYLYICLVIIALSIYSALKQNQYTKVENENKIRSKSLAELRKRTLSKLSDYANKQTPSEAQILEYNNNIVSLLAVQVKEELRKMTG